MNTPTGNNSPGYLQWPNGKQRQVGTGTFFLPVPHLPADPGQPFWLKPSEGGGEDLIPLPPKVRSLEKAICRPGDHKGKSKIPDPVFWRDE